MVDSGVREEPRDKVVPLGHHRESGHEPAIADAALPQMSSCEAGVRDDRDLREALPCERPFGRRASTVLSPIRPRKKPALARR